MENQKRLRLLDEIVVAAPCPVSWESMIGDDTVRLCCGCSRNVYNISDMTSSEAEQFLVKNGNSQCMQIYRRTDGKVMTDNCPRVLRPLRNKCKMFLQAISGVAASVLAFLPLPGSSVGAQEASSKGDVYIPPAKQTSTPQESKGNVVNANDLKPAANPTHNVMVKGKAAIQSAIPSDAKSTCKKKVILGADECNDGKPQQPQVLRGEPMMSPGLVAMPQRPGNGADVPQVNPEGKPDLRDSKALLLFRDAQRSETEGKSMLAQTQYLEALKAAMAQKDGDPKFKQLIQSSCNNLRKKLNMPAVDLNGKAIK